MRTEFTSPFPFSSDGKTFFAFGRDVFELSASTHEVVSKIPLATPIEAGYGPRRAFELYSPEPGIYYGLVGITDPFLKKATTGVLRLDLSQRTASSFEVGPRIDAQVFALSADGKTGYAGVKDLAKIDMKSGRIVLLKKDFLQGRAATVLILVGRRDEAFPHRHRKFDPGRGRGYPRVETDHHTRPGPHGEPTAAPDSDYPGYPLIVTNLPSNFRNE